MTPLSPTPHQTVTPADAPTSNSGDPEPNAIRAVGAMRIPKTSRAPKGWRRSLGDARWKTTGTVHARYVDRSLVYFADADADPRPLSLTSEHWEAIKKDLRSWVKALA